MPRAGRLRSVALAGAMLLLGACNEKAGGDAAAGEQAGGCDRDCLTSVVDRYLTAMVAHDPTRAPFAEGAKFTENTSPLSFTDGLWLTSTALDPYRVLIRDPETSQVAYVGIVREHGRPVLLAARFKAPGGRITEVETVVARDLKLMKNLQTPRAPIMQTLPQDQRVSRDKLVALANAYFDGIERSDGKMIPFDAACDRLENGLQTTNNPDLMAELAAAAGEGRQASAPTPLPPVNMARPAPSGPRPAPSPSDCTGQIDSGTMSFITSVRPRRGYVVDEETGTVFGLFMFNHRGASTDITRKDGTTMPDPFGGQPWSMQMAEFFKTRSGKIWLVEAIGTPLPFGARMGWE